VVACGEDASCCCVSLDCFRGRICAECVNVGKYYICQEYENMDRGGVRSIWCALRRGIRSLREVIHGIRLSENRS
jgi:hypothetical protein